jgi:hypothetical protein
MSEIHQVNLIPAVDFQETLITQLERYKRLDLDRSSKKMLFHTGIVALAHMRIDDVYDHINRYQSLVGLKRKGYKPRHVSVHVSRRMAQYAQRIGLDVALSKGLQDFYTMKVLINAAVFAFESTDEAAARQFYDIALIWDETVPEGRFPSYIQK